ncbi:hypothetical protein BJ742DRAFT_825680 [Cladochytrium replicatum]|nr:hypothetical protein BJ742DRAFT_825680 [Cladochytrium replicatum]
MFHCFKIRAIHNFRYFSTYILHLENPTSDLDGVATSFAVRQPVGVAALISPWNLPLFCSHGKLPRRWLVSVIHYLTTPLGTPASLRTL